LAVYPAITAAKEDSSQSAECITDSGQASTAFVNTDTAEDVSVGDSSERLAVNDVNDDHSQADRFESGNQPFSFSSGAGDAFDPVEEGSLIPEQIQPEQPDYASTGPSLNVDEKSGAKETASDVPVTPSGLLGGLDSDIEFTGALSRGVCIACGAESSTDDLFCLACGVFIEDIS
jgi:hypothetical protein